MKNFPASFMLFDEIYQIKDFSRKNARVLLRLDAGKIDLSRKGVKRTDTDFPVIWAKNYGKGRVLYNGLGHVHAYGSVRTFRGCGWKWSSGPWAQFLETPLRVRLRIKRPKSLANSKIQESLRF